MEIHPLPKKFYDRARAINVSHIHLHFSGGSDESFLNIDLDGLPDWNKRTPALRGEADSLASDIEDWAWENWSYSGAGDGTDYGDDITYNLLDMTASHADWCMERREGQETDETFKLVEDEEEEPEPEQIDTPEVTATGLLHRLVAWHDKTDDFVSSELREIVYAAEELIGKGDA